MHVRLGIAHQAPDHQDIGHRDTGRRTTATCQVMEPGTGDGMQLITGAGTTTLKTGGNGQPLQQ